MSRSRRGKKAGEDAERLLQEAFGVSEDQLLKDFILAQTEVKDSDIPPESEDGFERLMAKLEAEVGTSPESEKESSSENIVKLHEEARKPRRLKSIVKVSVAAAAIAVMVVAMGISAGAKREYRYVVREEGSVRSDIVLNNVDMIQTEDALEKAIDTCIHQDVLADFLKKHRAEVTNMILTTYDKDLYEKTLKEDAREEGRAEIRA